MSDWVFFFLLVHTLTPSRETTDDCNAGGGSLVLSDLRAPHISTGGPCGRGANPVFPHQEVCLVNFSPLLHGKKRKKKFTRHRQPLLMRHTKLFAGFPPCDRMLNEKLRATRVVCYHSICLRPQTGHYPAIIFLDLQSRVEEAIAAACSPLGGTDGNQLENLHLHDPAEQLIRSGYLFST